jgi:hypothetical protein
MRISENYITTLDPHCLFAIEELKSIRKSISIANAETDTKFRVEVKARGPRRVHAITDGLPHYAYDQWLPIRHAERLDVYVYRR